MLRYGHRLANTLEPCSLGLKCVSLSANSRQYGSKPEISPEHNVAILGGGISGLASAYYLTKELPKARITIYEASDRLGGWLNSSRVPVKGGTVLFEGGPRTLRPGGNGVLTAKMMQELDLAKDAIFPQKSSPAACNRYVYYPDHLVRMPHPAFGLAENLWNLWTEPVFKTATWSAAKEIFVDGRDPSIQDESVGEFLSRRLSKTVVDRIISAVLHGIYAGDAWQLSAKSLFPIPWRDEGTAGSIFAGMLKSRAEGIEITKREAEFLREMKAYHWDPLLKATLRDTAVFTFREGLGMLVDKLARHLLESGNVEFRTSTPVETISLADDRNGVIIKGRDLVPTETYKYAISTLSPSQLNLINKPLLSQSGRPHLVPPIPSVTAVTANLYFRTPDLHPPGFGYLIPQATPFEQNPERALGVVFDTAYSPGPKDLDLQNWQVTNIGELKQARDGGHLINVNDFAWYNMPEKPNTQDDLEERGTKLTVMLGGHWWNDWPAYPDEKEALALARSVIKRHLGITEEPEAYQVNLSKDCIPQYTVGHEQRLRDAHNNIWREYKGRLRVAGNWMDGVGVNDCLRSAFDTVRGIARGRDATGLEHVGTQEYVRLPVRAAAQP